MRFTSPVRASRKSSLGALRTCLLLVLNLLQRFGDVADVVGL
jgi:hypothetical protein